MATFPKCNGRISGSSFSGESFYISLMKRPPSADFTCRPNSSASRREETVAGGSPERSLRDEKAGER
jgi:hypothetical protein